MRIHFYATFRDIVGAKHLELDLPDGIAVQEILDRVLIEVPDLRSELLDERGVLSRHVHIFVNGRSSVFLDKGLETQISTREDRIDFFPAVAGG